MAVALVASFVFSIAGQGMALAAGPAAIGLGAAGNFAILSKTGISTTGSTVVIGDIGVSPSAATYITGFSLALPASSAFSTSALITGKVYAPGYADPTPATLTTSVGDMQTAYTDGAGRTNPTATELNSGNLGGLTLAPGLYKWGTGVTIPTDVTLSGGANDVWIFQIAQNLDISSGVMVILAGGAQPSNIFWVVAGQTTIGTNAVFNGNILDQTAIVLNTGAKLNGRALAQTAVTLDSNIVTAPTYVYTAPAVVVPPPAATSTPVMCTMEALQCPGGSYVSRQGPTCAFAACPVVTTSQTTSVQATSSAEINAALQSQINGLMATLQGLQAKATQQGLSAVMAASPVAQVRALVNDMKTGSTGSAVKSLQQFLILQNKGAAARALGSNGATTTFGALTRKALAEFQASVGISPALGYFGPTTRAYIRTYY